MSRHAFTRRSAKKTAAAFLSICLLGSVAACSEPLPTVQTRMGQLTSNTQNVETAVTEDQEKTIRSRILEVVNEATANHDASKLASRVTGPELDVRTSEIAVYTATGNASDITEPAYHHHMASVHFHVHNNHQRPAVTASSGDDAGFPAQQLQVVGRVPAVPERFDAGVLRGR